MKAHNRPIPVKIEYFRFQLPVTSAPLIRMPPIPKLSESDESDSISADSGEFQLQVKAWILGALAIFKLKIKGDILTARINPAQVIGVPHLFWPFLILPNHSLHCPILLLQELSQSELHLIRKTTLNTAHQLILLIHYESFPGLAQGFD